MTYIKKIAAIHDISCFGRASLTTIIPILSVMKYQVCPVPTAVLSTHTGGFGKPAVEDLSNFMKETKEHWKKLKLDFQCIYSGYLASSLQVNFVKEFITEFKKNDALVVVDPVMGDDGKLYSSMDISMIDAMKDLIKDADVITPNITEATLLLGENYRKSFSEGEIKEWLVRLSNLGPTKVIITSVPSIYGDKYIDTVAYDSKDDKLFRITNKNINESYPGTGDAFASVLIGGILDGDSLKKSIERGCNFISDGIEYSNKFEYPRHHGIMLENILYKLMK